MEPGSGVSHFRHYMGTVSGWECCDGEEGSRGLDGQFSGLLLCCFLACFLACMVVARRPLVSYNKVSTNIGTNIGTRRTTRPCPIARDGHAGKSK